MKTCDFDYTAQVELLDEKLNRDCDRAADEDERIRLHCRNIRAVRYLKSLDELVSWFRRSGMRVELTTNLIQDENSLASMDWANQVVKIDTRLAPRNKFFCAAHEAGHFLIDRDRHRTGVNEFPYGWSSSIYNTPKMACANVHRMDILMEEVEAWRRGKRQIDELDLWYSVDDFYETRTRLIRYYCEWALRVGGYAKSRMA